MIVELTVLVDDNLSGKQEFARAAIDFDDVSAIREDSEGICELVNPAGDGFFLVRCSFEELYKIFVESRKKEIVWGQ